MDTELMEIIEKVRDLFFRYGIKSVTMDDVAKNLGISKKTLYQHFSDKAQLVEMVVKTQIRKNLELTDRIKAESSDAISEVFFLHQFMDKMAREHSHSFEYDLRKYYPALFSEILKVKRERIYQKGKENIERGKISGHYRQEVNSEIIAKTNLMRFESSMDSCIFTSEELLSQNFFTEILIYHVRGIATAKGIERLEVLLTEVKGERV